MKGDCELCGEETVNEACIGCGFVICDACNINEDLDVMHAHESEDHEIGKLVCPEE